MGRFSDKIKNSSTSSGFSGNPYFDWARAGITADDMYKIPKRKEVKAISHLIDIVPYIIGSKLHPEVAKGNTEIGAWDYNLAVWVHKMIGPGKHDILCPKRNYGKHCPLCDMAKEAYDTKGGSDSKDYKNLRAKQREIYAILDATQDGNAIKFFEISQYQFGEPLIKEARIQGEAKGTGPLDFADPDEGFTIAFRSVGSEFQKNASFELERFAFEKRPDGIVTEELVESVPSLDTFLILHTPDEIMNLFYGGDTEEEAPAPKFTRGHAVEDAVQDDPPARPRQRVEKEEEFEDDPIEAPAPRRRAVVQEEEDENPTPRRRARTVL